MDEKSLFLFGYDPSIILEDEVVKAKDGTSADYYKLPDGATELKHLIWYKNMNAQIGEAFRSLYRYDDCPHSDPVRNLKKVIAYCEQELERIGLYE